MKNQSSIGLFTFSLFTLFILKHEALRWNRSPAVAFLVAAFWLVFKE